MRNSSSTPDASPLQSWKEPLICLSNKHKFGKNSHEKINFCFVNHPTIRDDTWNNFNVQKIQRRGEFRPCVPHCPVVFHLTWGMISSRKDSKERISSQALSSRTKNPHQYTFCASICHSEIQKTLVVKFKMYYFTSHWSLKLLFGSTFGKIHVAMCQYLADWRFQVLRFTDLFWKFFILNLYVSDNQKYLIDLSQHLLLIVGEEKDKFLFYLKLMWALLISFCPILFRLKIVIWKKIMKIKKNVWGANLFALIL